MIVQDYMTKDPICVKADDPLSQVGQVFDVAKFRHLPVVDHSHSLVGILSDRDLRNIKCAMEILETAISSEEKIRVRDVMTDSVHSVGPEESMTKAAQMLVQLKIGALPVVKENKLIGILSYTDLLRAFVDLQA